MPLAIFAGLSVLLIGLHGDLWLADRLYAMEGHTWSLQTGYITQDVKPFPLEWLTIELPARGKIAGIEIDSRGEKSDNGNDLGWAPFYSVEASDDGKTWTMVDAKVVGEPHARLNFAAPVETRHLRIAIVEKEGWQPWVIKELNLYGDEE